MSFHATSMMNTDEKETNIFTPTLGTIVSQFGAPSRSRFLDNARYHLTYCEITPCALNSLDRRRSLTQPSYSQKVSAAQHL
jgi:hypothetical protein